jgi:hypothetical protein
MARRVVHFGQRLLIVAIVLITAVFAWRSGQTRDQREAIKTLRHQNIIVHYDYQRAGSPGQSLLYYDPNVQPAAPRWLRKMLGDAFLYDVAFLEVAPPYPPETAVEAFVERLPDCPVIYR